jgi:1-deoxy-D-xylulose-5-phosphate reductoisomerase
MKRVAVLGSTGSIGRQTLDIIRQHPDRLQAVALAAGSSAEALQEQAHESGAPRIALYHEEAARQAGIPGGMQAIVDLATAEDVDIVVVSVAGVIGLLPTIAAIKAGKDIALASKEVLVAAGEIVMPLVHRHGIAMTPIDSEHSALFQCMQGYRADQIEELIITGSGGPFRGRKREELEAVTVEQALKHPTWNMGGKITIDSATLMNKGLEMIEARWLFGVEMERVSVVIHPQSVVHSMVRFKDGSVLGQMGWPDMRLPIQYALLYPERKPNELPAWDPVKTPSLTFESPDEEAFPALRLAREAARAGGTMPCALNAANEEAANRFLRGEIGFLDIVRLVEKAMQAHTPLPPTLENILEVDRASRQIVKA